MSNKSPMTEEVLARLNELGVKHIHMNNGGKELTEKDYLTAIIYAEEMLRERKSKPILDK